MSFFTPNLIIGNQWRSTLISAFSQLRKLKIAVEDTFSFGSFDPSPAFFGMTTTLYSLRRARYLKLGKLLFFSVNFGVTLAAPLAAFITVTLPYTAAGDDNTFGQAGAVSITNAATAEPGVWTIAGKGNTLFITRSGVVNYGAAATVITLNGFIEVS